MIDYDRWIHYSTYCIEPWLGLLTVRSMYLCRKHLNNTFLRPFMEQRCYYNPKIPKGSGNPPRLVLYLVNFGDCRFRWNRLSIEMASPGGRQQGNVQIRKYHVELLWIDNKLTSKFSLARNLLLLQLNRTRCTRCIMHAISAPAHKGITQIILEVIHHNHCSYIYLQKCVVYSQNRTPPSTSRIACHVECTTKLAILGILLHRVHFLLHPFPMALGR